MICFNELLIYHEDVKIYCPAYVQTKLRQIIKNDD